MPLDPTTMPHWEQLPGGPDGLAVLFALMIVALVHCFFGYVVFRVVLVVDAVLLSGWLASAVLPVWRSSPTGLDYFVAWTAAALLTGMAAWFLWRALFAILAAGAAAAGVFALGTVLGIIKGSEQLTRLITQPTRAARMSINLSDVSAGVALACVCIGVVVGVLAFVRARGMIIFLSSLLGGFAAALSAGVMIAPDRLRSLLVSAGPAGRPWAAIALLGASLCLCAAGMAVQKKLLSVVRITFSPDDDEKRKTPKSSHGQLQPRFTRP